MSVHLFLFDPLDGACELLARVLMIGGSDEIGAGLTARVAASGCLAAHVRVCWLRCAFQRLCYSACSFLCRFYRHQRSGPAVDIAVVFGYNLVIIVVSLDVCPWSSIHCQRWFGGRAGAVSLLCFLLLSFEPGMHREAKAKKSSIGARFSRACVDSNRRVQRSVLYA